MDNIIFATKDLFTNYVNFKGRLPRAGYWFGYLGFILISIIVEIIAGITDLEWLTTISSLVFVLPMLSAAVRRFHDVGKSGWIIVVLYVISFIALIIAFMSLTFGVVASITTGEGIGLGLILFIIGIIVSFCVGIYEIVILATKPDGPNQYGAPETFEEYKSAREIHTVN